MPTFVLTQLHSKLPKLKEWRMLVTGASSTEAEWAIGMPAKTIANRIFRDPHMNSDNPLGPSYIKAAGLASINIFSRLLAGESLLVNKVGGYCLYSPQSEIKRVTQDKWPDEEHEVFTLSRWPNGTHWYPSSSDPTREFNGMKWDDKVDGIRWLQDKFGRTADIRVKR